MWVLQIKELWTDVHRLVCAIGYNPQITSEYVANGSLNYKTLFNLELATNLYPDRYW